MICLDEVLGEIVDLLLGNTRSEARRLERLTFQLEIVADHGARLALTSDISAAAG
jgi:hypothetical protein